MGEVGALGALRVTAGMVIGLGVVGQRNDAGNDSREVMAEESTGDGPLEVNAGVPGRVVVVAEVVLVGDVESGVARLRGEVAAGAGLWSTQPVSATAMATPRGTS